MRNFTCINIAQINDNASYVYKTLVDKQKNTTTTNNNTNIRPITATTTTNNNTALKPGMPSTTYMPVMPSVSNTMGMRWVLNMDETWEWVLMWIWIWIWIWEEVELL